MKILSYEFIGALLTNGNEEYVWHGDVLNVMEYYTERTPGSMIERKCASIVWHYRQADISFGEWQAKELQTHLEETVASTHPVDILAGKKNIEVCI